MSDIVEWLRARQAGFSVLDNKHCSNRFGQAADEIERLRAENEQLRAEAAEVDDILDGLSVQRIVGPVSSAEANTR